jgi:hypothetical protein
MRCRAAPSNGPRHGDDNRESHGPDLNAIVVQKSAVDVDATMPAVPIKSACQHRGASWTERRSADSEMFLD